MNSAEYVDDLILRLKAEGNSLQEVAWKAALACVGWPYVFGARGHWCDPSNRRYFYSSHGNEHPTIKTSCRNFNGSDNDGNCSGCKWWPSGKRTRCFDCRGFTYWILKQVYHWQLMGAGATSQWNTASNWKAKGEIATIPKDTLCCLFVRKGNTMEHTGFGFNNETVECSVGVQYFEKRNKKWTHWAVPSCINETPTPTPDPDPTHKPTLRKGDSGEYVTLFQTKLYQLAYDIGSSGIDGKFGSATEKAVKEFQKDNGLPTDGIVGQQTWDYIDKADPKKLYTVTIQHLPYYKAEGLVKQYDGCSYMTQEGGE